MLGTALLLSSWHSPPDGVCLACIPKSLDGVSGHHRLLPTEVSFALKFTVSNQKSMETGSFKHTSHFPWKHISQVYQMGNLSSQLSLPKNTISSLEFIPCPFCPVISLKKLPRWCSRETSSSH